MWRARYTKAFWLLTPISFDASSGIFSYYLSFSQVGEYHSLSPLGSVARAQAAHNPEWGRAAELASSSASLQHLSAALSPQEDRKVRDLLLVSHICCPPAGVGTAASCDKEQGVFTAI